MSRPWIVQGDATASGGRVITSSQHTDIAGKGVARLTDKATCPKHQGVFAIVGGCDPTTIVDHQPVALHGAILECGCQVLAMQQIRVLMDSGAARGPAAAAAAAGALFFGTGPAPAVASPPNPGGTGQPQSQASRTDPGVTDAEPMPPVTAAGSANEEDVALVKAELAKIPAEHRQQMAANDVEVVVVRGSVTDYYTELQGVRPRGWPPGKTWDDVPGMCRGKTVVIATRGHGTPAGAYVPTTGDGHGSYNLVLHESGHALRKITGDSPEFVSARTADMGALSAYQTQAGEAGLDETYAESFANAFGGNPAYARTHPNLYDFWRGP